jgi:hypothetical protein
MPLNVWLVLLERNAVYETVLVLQSLSYLIALLGKKLSVSGKSYTFISVVYYFFFMQFAAIAGLIKFQRKRQTAIWEKIPRNEEDAKHHDF